MTKNVIPDADIFDLTAKALGESPEKTEKRGKSVWTFIHDLIQTNAHANRRDSSAVCSRIGVSVLVLDTLRRSETEDFIRGDSWVAKKVLANLDQLQEVIDRLRGWCNKALENGNSQGPK